MTGTFLTVSLSLIDEPPSPLRGSIDPEKLRELAASIAAQGLLQAIVLKVSGDRFALMAGHRRFLAHRLLKRDTIPALVFPATAAPFEILAATENIQREDLTPIEEARLVNQLVNEQGQDVDAVAVQFGKRREWVDSRLELLDYPDDLLAALHTKTISLAVAAQFARVTDGGYRDFLLHNAIENGCTAKTARMWVDEWERSAIIQGEPTTGQGGPPPPYEGQAVGIACAACDTLYPIQNLRPLYTCPDCMKEHFATKAEARQRAAGGRQ